MLRIYTIKQYIRQITPPYLMDLIIYSYKLLRGKNTNIKFVECTEADNINFKSLYYDSRSSVINIPAKKIRHHGGQSYSLSQHHFIQYYNGGIEMLRKYYNNHKPITIFEKHFIFDKTGKQKYLPWLLNDCISGDGEHGLTEEHGNSAFGPVSERKLNLEKKRLDFCLQSIKKNGYLITSELPREYNGFPRGYFLISNSGEWVFRIVGAKHRAAALIWLGWKNIPVCCEPNFPKCIYESEISNWPGVLSGEFTLKDAKLIFDSYFRDPDLKIWS